MKEYPFLGASFVANHKLFVEAPPPSQDRPRRQRSKRDYAFMHSSIGKKYQEPPLKFTGIEVPKTVAQPVTYPVHVSNYYTSLIGLNPAGYNPSIPIVIIRFSNKGVYVVSPIPNSSMFACFFSEKNINHASVTHSA